MSLSMITAGEFILSGLQLSVKLTVLLALLFAIDRVCQRRHSGWRNLFWRTATIAVLLLPIAMATLPETPVALPSVSASPPVRVLLEDSRPVEATAAVEPSSSAQRGR